MNKFVLKCWNNVMLLWHTIDIGYEIVSTRPVATKISTSQITIVGSKNMLKWALIKCPCGCGDVLNLSLMNTHKPNWEVKFDKKQRVSLSPSVWKNDGCCSHFFIKKGKITWAT